MNGSDEFAGLPVAADPSAAGMPPRPRNYLATAERRRLMWRFMPAALAVLFTLTWIERAWFPRTHPRPAAPIDTRLEAVQGAGVDDEVIDDEVIDDEVIDDEVIMEAESAPVVADAAALGAPASALARVRDDTFFRDADMEAWQQTFATLRETDLATLLRSPASRVSFSELFGQPRSFRGRLVRIRGTLHRLERLDAPDNRYGIESYWQAWLEPDGGPASPIVVQCLRLPEAMPVGMEIHEPVEVVGYFLKRYAYQAADAIRVAPLVMALEPVRRPPPVASTGAASLGTWALVSMAALVAATVLGLGLAGRRDRRPPESADVDLTGALAGHEPFSAAESLRRLGGAAAHDVKGDAP